MNARMLFWNQCAVAAIAALALVATNGQAGTVTPVFYDGFNVSAGSSDLNFEIGAPRQGGPLIPVSWDRNAPVGDFHHQLLGVGPLQLAGEASLFFPLASPIANFKGVVAGGILGKCITFDMDAGALITGNAASYITAAVSIGASSTLVAEDAPASHFGVRVVEDNFGGFGNFLQFFDGNSLVQNVVAHVAGAGPMSMRLQVDDIVDGNPWDGVGSTTITVFVNGIQAGTPFTKGGGGYANNFITFGGSPNLNGIGLATHTFDNLTVFAAPVPEPTAGVLIASVMMGGLTLRRRRTR